jgi:transcriptional regulator with XRE-family HTH domain
VSTVTTPRAPDRRELGERISTARRRAGLTQRELGDRIGLSLWQVERMESGNGDFDSAVVLPRIAEATKQPPGFFIDPFASELFPPEWNGRVAPQGQAVAEYDVAHPETQALRGGERRLLMLGVLATLILVRFSFAAARPRGRAAA